jgi:hypothetical protein
MSVCLSDCLQQVVYVSALQYYYLFICVTLVCQHVFSLPHSAVFNTSYLLREVSHTPHLPIRCVHVLASLPLSFFGFISPSSTYPVLLPYFRFLLSFPPLFITPPTFLSFSTQSSPTLLYPTLLPSPPTPPPFQPTSSPFPPLPHLLSYITSY